MVCCAGQDNGTHHGMGGARGLRPCPPLQERGLVLVAPRGGHGAPVHEIATVGRGVEPGRHAANHRGEFGLTSPNHKDWQSGR